MSQKKKILVVAESIDVEDSSGTKGRVALIKNLQKGFEVRVYHYTRKKIELEGVSCVAIKENRRSLSFLLSRFERHLRYKTGWHVNKFVENLIGFSFTFFNDSKSIVAGLNKAKDFKPDMVLTLSKGGSFRPHHALLRIPKWHNKWIAYIHDPYPMHSYPRPYDWVEPGHQQKRKFFLKVSKNAKYAAYPSQLLAEWMESYYPPLRGKAVVVPHQIAEEKTESSDLPDYFQKDAFTVVHAGALMSARNPMSLIRAFKEFLKQVPEAAGHSQLLFLGDRSKYTQEFQRVKEELPQFYSSDHYLPFSTVMAVQKNASVNVILEAKGPISPFLPGKFPHCVVANKPILLLGPHYSECRRLLGETYPYTVEIDDIGKISLLIEKLYFQWKEKSVQKLNRPDLVNYLSEIRLKETIDELF